MDLSTLKKFAEDLKGTLALSGRAQPEDQLKPLVAELLRSAGKSFGLTVKTNTETPLSEIGARPDMGVHVGGLICGYIELKAPGRGADAPKLKEKHDKAQWEKLKGLPNLIYTDGREWALYRAGERPDGQPIVRLHDDPTEKGKAAVTGDNAEALERLLRDFLRWEPIVPHTARELAKYLAPLTRFLRAEVESALKQPDSAINLLKYEWRQFFSPDVDDAKFADAYAQTVTYAMLLARLSGARNLEPAAAAQTLDQNNGLLAQTLALLGQAPAREELSVGFDLLRRSLEALDPYDFLKSKPDLWLYFYEDFLAAYDPKLRKNYGVYYTPREVVEFQVRLADKLLETQFGKKLGFADDGVVFLDPAVGTGTYPVAAIKHGLDKVRDRSGPGAIPARARQMAENMRGFEILVGPYAVAHLRLTQALEGAMNADKADGEPQEKLSDRLNIFLADTLESPNQTLRLDLTHKVLIQEHKSAQKVKQGGDILVCLGNPPYNRQQIEHGDESTQRKGGWVRNGDMEKGGAKSEELMHRPIFDDFTEPVSMAGQGIHTKNLYNDYVYFWRWALWRLFTKQADGGIITFITASSYLSGPGFVGMREVMRQTFDDLWIIDLGGDNLGTRKTPNVFDIQTPVAVAIGVRGAKPSTEKAARVRYAEIKGSTRENKLQQLEAVRDFDGLDWHDCPDDWDKPFLPEGQGDYFLWPQATNLFPWQNSGCQLKRSWPIGETKKTLKSRWEYLISADKSERNYLLRRTSSRFAKRSIESLLAKKSLTPINSLSPGDKPESMINYGFRSFDRHFVILDARVGDAFRRPLVRSRSNQQIYLTTLLHHPLGKGPGMVCSANIPDMHHFRGSFGGKDVIPLYRDAAATQPNVTGGLLETLGEAYDAAPSAEELAAYVYTVLGGQSYTRRFWEELETPGPRVPLTRDGAVFAEAAELGRKLIWLHTYAERFQGEGRGASIPSGEAKFIKGVPDAPAKYPEKYKYDHDRHEIEVGEGRFGPVSMQVWEFEVSGLKVVQSWLGYRMKKRSGRKSSPLDDIRPERWTARMSDEFLELLWVLEATLAMEPELERILDRIVTGPCFAASDLPEPGPTEREAPGGPGTNGELL